MLGVAFSGHISKLSLPMQDRFGGGKFFNSPLASRSEIKNCLLERLELEGVFCLFTMLFYCDEIVLILSVYLVIQT